MWHVFYGPRCGSKNHSKILAIIIIKSYNKRKTHRILCLLSLITVALNEAIIVIQCITEIDDRERASAQNQLCMQTFTQSNILTQVLAQMLAIAHCTNTGFTIVLLININQHNRQTFRR